MCRFDYLLTGYVKAVARFLDANCKSLGYPYLWLIDTYDNLPAYTGKRVGGHTEVAAEWRSPFIGKSLDEVASFVKSVDIATKAVSRNYFAVLKKKDPGQSQRDCEVLICKTPNEAVGRTEVQYSEYQADAISGFHVAFDEDNWEVMMDEQGW